MRTRATPLALVSRRVGLTFVPTYVTTNRPFFSGRQLNLPVCTPPVLVVDSRTVRLPCQHFAQP